MNYGLHVKLTRTFSTVEKKQRIPSIPTWNPIFLYNVLIITHFIDAINSCGQISPFEPKVFL